MAADGPADRRSRVLFPRRPPVPALDADEVSRTERKGVTAMRNRVAWSLLCLGVLTGLAYLTLRAGPLESVVYLIVAAIGVAMSVIGACLVRGSRRRVWVIMAVGQVLYLAGDVLWVIYEQI